MAKALSVATTTEGFSATGWSPHGDVTESESSAQNVSETQPRRKPSRIRSGSLHSATGGAVNPATWSYAKFDNSETRSHAFSDAWQSMRVWQPRPERPRAAPSEMTTQTPGSTRGVPSGWTLRVRINAIGAGIRDFGVPLKWRFQGDTNAWLVPSMPFSHIRS